MQLDAGPRSYELAQAALSLCRVPHDKICAGLALVIPSGQSLVADYHSPLQRGRAFGVLYLTSASGGMLGALFATNLGMQKI